MAVRTADEEARWHRARFAVLARDQNRCVQCAGNDQLHVHHLVPRHLGGADDPANLITLCGGCHAARHHRLQASLSRVFLERWAFRISRLLDKRNEIPSNVANLGIGLRLLGRSGFRPGQLRVVLAALRRESLLVVLPTGSGKSLCFQLAAVLSHGTAFVITPLKVLMADQVADLTERQIPATYINSDISTAERVNRLNLLDRGVLKLLYLAPERFDPRNVRNQDEIDHLASHRPSYLVIDEAHCVDRWGDSFRPSYGRLAHLRRQLGNPPVLAFTATAGGDMQRRIVESLGVPNARIFVSEVDRPNIGLIRLRPRAEGDRLDAAVRLVNFARSQGGKALIFVPTIKMGEAVRVAFTTIGYDVPFYHSKLDALQREMLFGRVTGRLQPELDAILCTNAFGMGVDIPNIRVVLHWAIPESVEDFAQEFGRAGRDGKPSIAAIFDWPEGESQRRFLARMSARDAGQSGQNEGAILARKNQNIDQLLKVLRSQNICFRKLIRGYFSDEPDEAPPLALRLLERLFGDRRQIDRSSFCCDACHPSKVQRLLSGKSL